MVPTKVYWLRRIPAETRIVVLVVFLALFQAILLSVFGLGAIRHERQQAANQLDDNARDFLQQYVADGCQAFLRDRAGRAFRAAFDRLDSGWRRDASASSDGLFTDAFRVLPDHTVQTPAGRPLWLPPESVDVTQETARAMSKELRQGYRRHDFEPAVKVERHLAYARDYPFARDGLDHSLALLHAATPLYAETGPPDGATLVRMRWVGVLNQVAGYADAGEVERFLARIDAAAGDDDAYRDAVAAQEQRARVVQEFVDERPSIRVGAPPLLHRNIQADPNVSFYVRTVDAGELHVLAVDPGRLQQVLDEVLERAQNRATAGVEPRIIAPPSAAPGDGPAVPVPSLPGYLAVARISEDAVLERASKGERFYWYIIGFSVAGILAGGLLTARVVMREMKLAKLKAGFVSNVSHGLKTPLTSIRMFSEMLRSGKVKDETERNECLDVITKETDRLAHLIQQVLDFGRLEAGRRPFSWRVASIEPILKAEAERFRKSTAIDETSFRVHIAVNLPPVNHDPEALGEVIANLLGNAHKYTANRARRIELTAGPQGGRVVISVEDNGPGIQPGERRKIFEQFYRADDLLTREVEGTGLGLSIARNIVLAHGGRIFVEDGSDGGSRFLVILPAAPKRAVVESSR